MFEWLFGRKKDNSVEEEIKKSFSAVKKDMDSVGKWIKHLEQSDKQLFDVVNELQRDLSSIKDEIDGLRESVDMLGEGTNYKQVFKKMPVLSKQTPVEDVDNAVQIGVQTGNFYNILKGLSANEKLLIFTILNSEMKLSYEDLALLLGKERATIRGQVNIIKQKNEGLIEEVIEKNGKKRVFIPDEIKEKLMKYAKVRVNKKKKADNEGKSEEYAENSKSES